MRNGYFKYLVEKIGGYNKRGKLLAFLYKHEFRWDYAIYLDEDRADNGRRLRIYYSEETGRNSGLGNDSCNCLEMLISLSESMSELMGPADKYEIGRWFWELMDNLGVGDVTDDRWDAEEDNVIDIIGTWLSRKYDNKGHGNVFNMRHKVRDFNKMAIWNQACMYINEYYF